MLAAFGKAFKTPDLRKKIIFTLSIMALFRLGSVVPTPGVSYVNVQECLNTADT
ncbi:MAG: preprotein translocase subunit SecY, partial [Actinomycetes bacterium]